MLSRPPSIATSDDTGSRRRWAPQRLKLLVRRFLDLARGGLPTFASVDSSSVARGAVSLVNHRFDKEEIALAVDVPSHSP